MPDKIKTFRSHIVDLSERKAFGAKPKPLSEKRAASKRVYNSTTWQRLRLMHIAGSPLCVECGGYGEQVDHIVPISRGGEKFDPANLQTLCASCHASKTRRDNRQPTSSEGGDA